MKYINISLLLLSASVILNNGANAEYTKKKTFVFSGDANLNVEHTENEVPEKNEITKIEEQMKEMKKENEEVKDMVSVISEQIKEKSQLNKISTDEFSPEKEEEARENAKFLTDEMEESANNFAEADDTEETLESETEKNKIKKYQAEVINSMNHNGNYQNMDTQEFETIEHAMEHNEEICYPDFSIACPEHFFRTASGCVPTKSYKGPCNKIQETLMFLQDHQKQSWSEVCETEWPCMSEDCVFGTDYNTLCPVGWIDIGKGFCRNEQANNKCNKEMNFSRMTKEKKQELEKSCNMRWKCKSVEYVTNFDSLCPLDWTVKGKYQCEAPEYYNGDCPKIANLKKYNTVEQKKQIEIACLVNWPYEIKIIEFQRDYNKICPIGWSMLNNGFCKAPENYTPNENCKDQVSFGSMNNDQKISYSTACHVDFPYLNKSECSRDYSFECPMGWIPTDRKGFCKAPADYKNKICKNIINFNNITERHRSYYLKSCNIDWPCQGEIQNSMIYTNVTVNQNKVSLRKKISGAVDSITGLII